uniref:Aminopeptidase N-like N-terminal domain-containing protein n=1 Tax=Panagrolaimus sp. ES5 TaxID=591445 RepID=A0AC34GW24_9BILA
MNSLFETNHARELLPCFDEPNFRSVFKLQLWLQNDFASKGYVALSNTQGKKQSWSEALSIWTFDASPPIPTYLFTVTVGKFKSVCQFRHEIEKEICIWRFLFYDGWERTALEVINSMTLYQHGMMDYLLIDPSARLHLLVVPSKLNGMENFGLLNVKEAVSLWDMRDKDKHFL